VTSRLRDQDDISAGIAALRDLDPGPVRALVDAVGQPALRRRPPGFAGLAAVIVGQQLSTASANAIFGRLDALLDPVTAGRLLAASDEALRTCGLSVAKVRTLRATAGAVLEGQLDFDRMIESTAEAAYAELVAIPGIGPWTADVFLLFGLGHADILPAGDLALQEAARLILRLDLRPNARELARIAERWRPFRGVAAHLLWAYYRVALGRATP
jgi:DNA-3-methyladenine glycosylase II